MTSHHENRLHPTAPQHPHRHAATAACMTALILLSACDPRAPGNAETTATHSTPAPILVKTAFDRECEPLLLAQIDSAQKEILIAIYNITRKNITRALTRAVRRGVKVRLQYEATKREDGDNMEEAIAFMTSQGVKCLPVRMPNERAIMHHKFTVIDGRRVLTGSFNYTSSASTLNHENVVLIDSTEIARRFAEEFESMAKH